MDQNIDNWGNEAPLLAAIPRKNPFVVPTGYFDGLYAQLSSRINIEQTPAYPAQDFGIPQGYFENLPQQISSHIFLEKLRAEVAADGFIVPQHYFNNLPIQIQSKINQSAKPQKIKKLIPAWLNYAAAACVLITIGFALFLNVPGNFTVTVQENMTGIPEQEIINYLQTHTDVGDNPVILENLGNTDELSQINTEITTEDLEYYLTNTNSL